MLHFSVNRFWRRNRSILAFSRVKIFFGIVVTETSRRTIFVLLPSIIRRLPSEIFIRILWLKRMYDGNQEEGWIVCRIKVPCPMQIRSARVGLDGTWRDCGRRLPAARLISSRYVVAGVTRARNSRELLEIHRTSRPATGDSPLYTDRSLYKVAGGRWTFVSKTKLKTRFRLRFREIQDPTKSSRGKFLVWEIGTSFVRMEPTTLFAQIFDSNFQVARQIRIRLTR